MREQFPNQWLLIADAQLDAQGAILSGVVRHRGDTMADASALSVLGPVALRYTGELGVRASASGEERKVAG